MKARLGMISKYVVLRETDLGYMLANVDERKEDPESEEYFLHRNESNYQILQVNEMVNAFLYADKQKRLALSLYLPKCTCVKGALCTCVSTTTQGAYFNIGISKDMLLSSDDYLIDERPLVNDMLPIKLRLKGNKLYAQLLNKYEMLEMNDGFKYEVGEKTSAYVYRISKDGINLVDEHFNLFFIHKNNLRSSHHLGEKVEFSIFGVNEKDYYGTTILNKECMIGSDSEVILNYLKDHHGVMDYTEDTDPLIIDKVFHMSKAAFKRAIGHLYKDEKIVILEKRIILKR